MIVAADNEANLHLFSTHGNSLVAQGKPYKTKIAEILATKSKKKRAKAFV